MTDYQHSEPCPNKCGRQAPADSDQIWPPRVASFTHFLPFTPPTVPGVWAALSSHGCLPPHTLNLGSSPSTLYQVISGLPLHLGAELPGFLKILQDKDVGRKVDHVLLSTAKGQPQKVAEVAQRGPHDISW